MRPERPETPWNGRCRWFWSPPVTLWAVLSLLLTALAILLAAPFLGGRRAFHRIAPLWSRWLFRLGRVPFRTEGWEALPGPIRGQQQPVVFMCNHESNLDPPVLLGAIPVPAVYLAKKEVKWMVPIGWAAMMAGTIFIDRGHGERSVRSLQQAAQDIATGRSVIIFPEGTRTRDGRLRPFKKGGFALAQEAGVPIVPVAISGGFRMLPSGALWIRPGSYRVAFGDPVRPEDFPARKDLMAEVRTRMETLLRPPLA